MTQKQKKQNKRETKPKEASAALPYKQQWQLFVTSQTRISMLHGSETRASNLLFKKKKKKVLCSTRTAIKKSLMAVAFAEVTVC